MGRAGERTSGRLCLLLLLLAPAPLHAQVAPPTGDAGRPRGAWEDMFLLRTPDGAFRLRVGGLVQADGRWFPANTAPGPVDQFTLRSARIEAAVTVWRYVDGLINIDFGMGKVQVQEGWTELHLLDEVRLRAGKMKVPFGLERLQPEGRTAFMERSFVTQLSPNRDIGVELFGDLAGGAVSWAAGVYNGAVDNTTADLETDGDKEEVARLFFRPFRPTRIAALRELGVGGAFSFTRLGGTPQNPSLVTLQTDGLTPFFRYVDGGTSGDDTTVAAGQRWRATAQADFSWRRLGVMAEYVWNSMEVRRATNRRAVVMQAWQAYATFLLTDDEASYTGVKPRDPVGFTPGQHGRGAWEIGFRYSGWQADDGAFDGATPLADPAKTPRAARSYTAGLTWYLDANAKVQLDYVRTELRGGSTSGDRPSENAIMGRLQWSL